MLDLIALDCARLRLIAILIGPDCLPHQVSAMVDFSTSGSLQLARQVDPSGERTLLCVTKVDEGEGC